MLASWLYVSTSRLEYEKALGNVADIVSISRTRNSQLDVTGALLFAGEHFVQFLEGPEDGIAALQHSIFRDQRHEQVTTIQAGDVHERQFNRWSLAYAGPSRLITRVVTEGVAESLSDPRQGGAILINLLHKFSPLG